MSFDLRLRHTFPNVTLDLDLSGPAGVTALFGPSGAGKTSVLKALLGTLKPDEGRAHLDGTLLFDTGSNVHLPVHKRRIGAVFQDGRLFPHLTVLQNLRFSKPYTKGQDSAVSEDALVSLLGLEKLLSARPASLSGGEAQRVALARALLRAPRMLVMDEPLAALDGPRKDAILPYLDRLKASTPIPILYVTHAVDELARFADHVALLQDGKIVQQGPVYDVLSSPAAMPLLGVREAGSVLRATVLETAPDGLTHLHTDAGPLELPGVEAAAGDTVRLHILARDIILATTRPTGLSARNILPATIHTIEPGRGPGAAVVLKVGTQTLLARITDRSRQDLALEPGQSVFAILKASAIGRPAKHR